MQNFESATDDRIEHARDVELADQLAQHVAQLLGLVEPPSRPTNLGIHRAHRGAQAGDDGDGRDGPQDRVPHRDGQAQIAGLEEDDADREEEAGPDPAPEVEAEDGFGGDQRVEQVGKAGRRRREQEDPAADDQVVQDEE